MTYELHHHDARHISELLGPDSVDLLISSPPYWSLRSYRDEGEHFPGQLGSEPTPGEFVDALIACTADWLRVLKPSGSLWVNLGDKYAGSGGGNQSGLKQYIGGGLNGFGAATRYNQSSDGIRAKSLMGLPWRYAIRCIDELGLILRAEVIWSKPNGLPESVTDRVRRSHEQWFHFAREPRYFAAIDEIREAAETPVNQHRKNVETASSNGGTNHRALGFQYDAPNPLGKAPGSVWSIPSEPLVVPDHLGVDHFAAFASELPRRIILGWSPSGYCTACGEPRRAVVDRSTDVRAVRTADSQAFAAQAHQEGRSGFSADQTWMGAIERTITGYLCACPDTTAPTRPAVVLDPFAGTGTVPAVAHLLGRHGVGTDLSRDYLRLAEWRCSSDQRLRDKVLDRTGIPNPEPPKVHGQLGLFGEAS